LSGYGTVFLGKDNKGALLDFLLEKYYQYIPKGFKQ